MRSEMESMYANQVWTVVDPLKRIKPIKCKSVSKKKININGNVQTFKGRLVTKDFKQIHGIGYDETFSPVVMLKTIYILLTNVVFYDYEI